MSNPAYGLVKFPPGTTTRSLGRNGTFITIGIYVDSYRPDQGGAGRNGRAAHVREKGFGSVHSASPHLKSPRIHPAFCIRVARQTEGVKKSATQFNCQKGDTVVVVRRKRGRSLRETLTIVSIGIENEHGHPLDFMAADKKGKAFKLSPFEDSDALRVVIVPKEVPAELARYKDHPEFAVARMPGCDRFTYRLVSRKNLEPVCRIRVERQAQDILFSDAVWWVRDEEVVSASEFFSTGGKRVTLKGLIIES